MPDTEYAVRTKVSPDPAAAHTASWEDKIKNSHKKSSVYIVHGGIWWRLAPQGIHSSTPHAKKRIGYCLWRCRVVNPGPKECITDFYKRSPFDSLLRKKTDKYRTRGLTGMILRNAPVNAFLTSRLWLHRPDFTGKKFQTMVLGSQSIKLQLRSDEH